MKEGANIPLVTTVRERCRMCYTCVRECPAKAIRIADGQAEVVHARCVGCGNCVRVCSQGAKRMYDSTHEIAELLRSGAPMAAMIAPSFPAEFADCPSMNMVAMIRALGFDYVHEVAFGADLVAKRYKDLLERDTGRQFVATTCPAIVAFVERYHPELVNGLAPVVSPMVAMARVLRRLHGADLRVVFIGPCIAKKGEIVSEQVPGDVDAGLTFRELREVFEQRGITPDSVDPTPFDPPHGGAGSLFPISRGLLQAAGIEEDLMDGSVVVADGRTNFVEALNEFESGHMDARLLEVLACNGCINGPGVSTEASPFSRRHRVSKYVRERMGRFDWDQWQADMERFGDLDLNRGYAPDDQRLPEPSPGQIREILRRFGKTKPQDELNCGACGYETCREHAIALHKGLAENEMCLPYSVVQLRQAMKDLAFSNDQLAQTREALVQSERLASMGQLAAGIAHELNNPLGVVLMYSHLLKDEMGDKGEHGEDLEMIAEQADRCKKIVAGLLHFARQNKVEREPRDVRELVERTVKSCPAPTGIEVKVVDELDDPIVPLDRDQMLQVMTNLVGNAFGAMPDGGTVTIRTWGSEFQAKISVSDTGVGIAKEHRDKIFEPFFTTKDVGKGTGLGLAVTYGIVKMHSGGITLESNDDPAQGPTGTTFTVSLPRE